MASAQVLPNSRKQEHLAAGKRRLEEFRKKKAADRAKKSSSSNGDNVTPSEKQPPDSQLKIASPSDGASRQPSVSEINDGASRQPSVSEINDGAFDNSQRSEQDPQFLINDTTDTYSGSSSRSKDKDFNKSYEVSSFNGLGDHSFNYETAEMKSDSAIPGGSYGLIPVHDFKGNEETLGKQNSSNSRDFLLMDQGSSLTSVASYVNSKRFPSFSLQTKNEAFQQSDIKGFGPDNGQAMIDVAISDVPEVPNIYEKKLASSSSGLLKEQTFAPYAPPQYSPTDHTTLYHQNIEAQPRRSRPSFLDSLNVSKGSSVVLPNNHVESRESISGNEIKIHYDSQGQTAIDTSYMDSIATSATAVDNGKYFPDAGEHDVGKKSDFYLPKRDEDFATLEQHIEDLTQEKFSLKRALDASRALAESLASENSSLTDSYNQQRSAVNQLKADLENLQEQLSRQLAELESFKHEYTNAQLECNAADERAKLLASEVIGLEEKALKLRSSELKLERQLNNSHSEIASFKKKVSVLERERIDLQSTISALQEEKKLLQSKFRKNSGGNSIETIKKNMSTSTDDLETDSIHTSTQQIEHSLSISGNGSSTSVLLPDVFQSNPEASFTYIPPEQTRMIESISTIISELALEKEELVKSLASVASDNSKLKDLNMELSRKLEAQTQRLELLTAQSMASDVMPTKHPNPPATIVDAAYADEGDEVVERVLGWIMKFFPGGPSRRRTSKLL
ncbi:hypothetical protein SAY86_026136 [Trapa natans]|uniref:BLISTER n=1 Tax=Trapa natans TaxID=22666 RepID=A0AAN7QE89_TRANT|nr:hypothetical protein SAY86_026136 [Trapa natans]